MVQILLFGVMAIEIKRKAPRAHTVLELVRLRRGNLANFVRGRLLYSGAGCMHACMHACM